MKIYVGDEIQVSDLEDLVSRDSTDEPSYTYLGDEIPAFKKGLPKDVESICPECIGVISARLFAEDGKVYMEKTCPEHGYFRELYWSDVDLYLKVENFTFGEGRGVSNPKVKSATVCPDHCGLCNMHTSHTVLGNIDLTNRCDMTCPVCFANSATQGYVYEPDFDTIMEMLRTYRETKPVAGRVVQFSGGEPTIHPRFFDIVAAARDMGFTHLQMASNGLNLADPEFCRKTAEAGMHTVYLQFDGTDDESHRKTRGRRGYYEKKLQALENMRRYRIHVVLVPTIVKGFNDDQVGNILKFAIENADICSGISYQPVALTGRYNQKKREQMRYTLPDLARDIERQTGLIDAYDDWFPIACVSPVSKLAMALRGQDTINITCHPHCSIATYMIVNIDDPINTATPLPHFVDVPAMLTEMNELAFKTSKARVKLFSKISAFNSLRKHFDGSKAPKGLSFKAFLDAMYGLIDKDFGRKGRGTQWKFLLIGGMHFMDSYNYEVHRVMRCVIHYSTPGGSLYPFCTYNSGPCFRERVEKRHSIPLEEHKARQGMEQSPI